MDNTVVGVYFGVAFGDNVPYEQSKEVRYGPVLICHLFRDLFKMIRETHNKSYYEIKCVQSPRQHKKENERTLLIGPSADANHFEPEVKDLIQVDFSQGVESIRIRSSCLEGGLWENFQIFVVTDGRALRWLDSRPWVSGNYPLLRMNVLTLFS